jgi:hypothetical protein
MRIARIGSIQDTTVEVRSRKEVMDLTADFLSFLFASYQEGTTDLSPLEIAGAGRCSQSTQTPLRDMIGTCFRGGLLPVNLS